MRETHSLTGAGCFVLLMLTGSWGLAAEHILLPVRTVMRPNHAVERVKRLTIASTDSLTVIAEIYPVINDAMTFGDTDHDGMNEVIIAHRSLSFELSYRILEEQGNNTYHEEYVGPYVNPFAVGDLDGDGKSEIVAQNSDTLEVYESTSPSTYPTELTWTSPPLTNIVGDPTIGDTDRDGKMEIIHSINTFGTSRLAIFECRGDNDFVEVFETPTSGGQDSGPKLIADLDQDGLVEIAFCGSNGYLHIFESPADDVWEETFVGTTGLYNAYAVAGGVDTDGNGKPELFVAGDGPSGRTTHVYEATSDNEFTRIASLTYFDGYTGIPSNVVADISGLGRPEYVWCVFRQLLVYHAVAPGEWVMDIGAIDPNVNGIHNAVHAFDVNGNGRAELFWATSARTKKTLVLEHPPVLVTDAQASPALGAEALTVVPNPCRTQATLFLGPRFHAAVASVAVFDAAGRLVSREPPTSGGSGQLLWAPLALRPGIYFLRVEGPAGRALATGRTVVLR